MGGRIRYETRPNRDRSDYECWVVTDTSEHDYRNVRKTVSVGSDGVSCNECMFDTRTGELIGERNYNIRSRENSKAHIYSTCCDFAKSKNIPRVHIPANGRHVVHIMKDMHEYIQASSGSTHEKRGILTADVDYTLPDGISGYDNVVSHVNGILRERFSILSNFGIPLPTAYQIHKRNGHFQIFWVLKDEIKVKELKWSNRRFRHDGKFSAYFDNTPMWGKYMTVTRFLNIIFGGDPAFTAWQIKNMFFDDPMLKDEFVTMWNSNGEWNDTIPEKISAYRFGKMHGIVTGFTANRNSDKIKHLCDSLSVFGISEDMLMNLVYDENTILRKNAKGKGFDADSGKKGNSGINCGRNQFVRKTTYRVVRESGNKISYEDAYNIVKKEYNAAIRENGKLKGTKNNGSYTENDFCRDMSGAYFHAVETYKSLKPYTEEQIARSVMQRKSQKNCKMTAMANLLENNPKLVANTLRNNRIVMEMLNGLGYRISNPRSIYNYKKEIGISGSQTSMHKRNYRVIDKGRDQRIARYNEVSFAKRTVDKNAVSEECYQKWQKRTESIYNETDELEFKKTQRSTLKLHTVEPVKYTDNHTDIDYALFNSETVYIMELAKNTERKRNCIFRQIHMIRQ